LKFLQRVRKLQLRHLLLSFQTKPFSQAEGTQDLQFDISLHLALQCLIVAVEEMRITTIKVGLWWEGNKVILDQLVINWRKELN
jgi:hypothetical protein